jgi:hypothetical protein
VIDLRFLNGEDVDVGLLGFITMWTYRYGTNISHFIVSISTYKSTWHNPEDQHQQCMVECLFLVDYLFWRNMSYESSVFLL